jgi:hypothetical protein
MFARKAATCGGHAPADAAKAARRQCGEATRSASD